MLPFATFDPTLEDSLYAAYDAAWRELHRIGAKAAGDEPSLRRSVADALIKATTDGERDPERLKALALAAAAHGPEKTA